MSTLSKKSRRERIAFVVIAFIFALTLLGAGRIIGDGYLIPALFMLGWAVAVVVILIYLQKRFTKDHDKE